MKKQLVAFLLAFAFLLPLCSFSGAGAAVKLGDVDGDGAITLRDSAIIARYSSGWSGYKLSDGRITYPGSSLKEDTVFFTGFGQADITPPANVPMAGFGNTFARLSSGMNDPLYATAVAMQDAHGNVALLISIDQIGMEATLSDPIRLAIAKRLGIAESAIFLSCTHTHSGPDVVSNHDATVMDTNRYQVNTFFAGIMQAAEDAVASLNPTKIYTASTYTNHLNFVRRYEVTYKDGTTGWQSVNTNRSDIATRVAHESEADEEVQLIYFEREGFESILLYNWQCHPAMTTLTDTLISSDFIGAARAKLESDLKSDSVRAVYFQGAAGNLNQSDDTGTYKTAGDYAYAQTVGNSLASVVTTAFKAKTEITGDMTIRTTSATYAAPYNWCEEEINTTIAWNKTNNLKKTLTEVEALNLICEHASALQAAYTNNGSNKNSVAFQNALKAAKAATNIDFNFYYANSVINRRNRTCTVVDGVATAIRKNATGDFPIYAVTVGTFLGFLGTPCELFDTIGTGIKHGDYLDEFGNFYAAEKSYFDMTFICGYTNGKEGYFPTKYAFSHGGYETFVSHYVPGTAEAIGQLAVDTLNDLYFQNEGAARKIVVKEMRDIMSLQWQSDAALHYNTETSGSNPLNFDANTTYPYMPYSHGSASRYSFISYATKKVQGVYYMTQLVREHFDGQIGKTMLSNDCADAVYWAWATVANSMYFRYTQIMTPEYGLIPVGPYTLDIGNDNAYTPSDGKYHNTDQICQYNGQQKMFQSYALLKHGDAAVQFTTKADGSTGKHHAVMFATDPVVVTGSDGTINGTQSYITLHQQTSVGTRVDYKMTFMQLYNAYYLPITIQELLESDEGVWIRPEVKVHLANANRTTYASWINQNLYSNYRISSAKIIFTDQNGKTQQMEAYGYEAGVNTKEKRNGDDFYYFYLGRFDNLSSAQPTDIYKRDPNGNFRSCNLNEFLVKGATYHFKLEVQLATGKIVTLDEKDINVGD